MNSSEVLVALKQKVVELSKGQVDFDSIYSNAALCDYGYVDSLTAVDLITFIDGEYNVSISEVDLVGALNNLQALADHIERHGGK